jgi:hypothetical protein
MAAHGLKCGENPATDNGCNDADAATYKTYVGYLVDYLRDYGFWPETKGVWYFSSQVACNPVVATNNTCMGSGNVDTPGPARTIAVEAMNIVTRAYLDNPEPTVKQFGDVVMDGAFGVRGWPSPMGPTGQTADYKIMDDYMDGGYFMSNMGTWPKWFGMPWGIGIASAWPVARMTTSATTSVGQYWLFGFPQASQPQRYNGAFGFEFSPTRTIQVAQFSVRQTAHASDPNGYGAFAVYDAAGALIAGCANGFSFSPTTETVSNCAIPATTLNAGSVYELVVASNSATARISAVNSGVSLGAVIGNGSTARVFTLSNPPTISGSTFTWSPTMGARNPATIEPPHVVVF